MPRLRSSAPVADVAYIALGSNLGDRNAYLASARNAMTLVPGVRLVAVSDIEETAPVGDLPQPPYLNQMIAVSTDLEPIALLRRLQVIERSLGRMRSKRWAARTIDLDIVSHGDVVLDSSALVLPHPGVATRGFWQREIQQLDAAAAVTA